MFDYVRVGQEWLPILTHEHVPAVNVGNHPPIAIFLACYTGILMRWRRVWQGISAQYDRTYCRLGCIASLWPLRPGDALRRFIVELF